MKKLILIISLLLTYNVSNAQIDLFGSYTPPTDTSLLLSKAQYNADTANYFRLNQSETVTGLQTTFNGLIIVDTINSASFNWFLKALYGTDLILSDSLFVTGKTTFSDIVTINDTLIQTQKVFFYDRVNLYDTLRFWNYKNVGGNQQANGWVIYDSLNSTDAVWRWQNGLALSGFSLQNGTTQTASTDGSAFLQNGNDLFIRNNENATINFGTNATNSRLVIQSDGTVTVGTATDQSSLFHVAGTITGTNDLLLTWAANVDAGFQRGTVDTDLTRIKLRSPDGTAWYLYIDDAGTVTTTTTAP